MQEKSSPPQAPFSVPGGAGFPYARFPEKEECQRSQSQVNTLFICIPMQDFFPGDSWLAAILERAPGVGDAYVAEPACPESRRAHTAFHGIA